MPNNLPIFAGCDNYGMFSVILDGKRYNFPRTDAASHERWKSMLASKNPSLRWKALKQIQISDQPKTVNNLTFKNWMNS